MATQIEERVRKELEAHGALLLQDPTFPSVAGLVAGERVRGSWWGHAKGQAIFVTCESLEARGDVLLAKLIDGKVTFLHRDRWADVLGIVTAGEPWQRDGLTPRARKLLEEVERVGSVRTDRPAGDRALRDAARELEQRLLVTGRSVHTESGAHAKQLESWSAWIRAPGASLGPLPTVAAARARFELLADSWQESFGRRPRYPW